MTTKQLQKTWDALGREDPLWAVMSHREMKGNRWKLEDFLQTGEREIADALHRAESLHPGLHRGRALDFGCGVGRLSQALGDHFETVDGVDIAPSMLARARDLNRHGERCRYHLNASTDLALFDSGRFDFVYCNIVLQHMPPRLSRRYLREFARVLAPCGLLIVQIPGEPNKYAGIRNPLAVAAMRSWDWLLRRVYLLWRRSLRGRPVMDMYGIPRLEVEALLQDLGLDVLEVDANDAGGPGWTSFRYAARRR